MKHCQYENSIRISTSLEFMAFFFFCMFVFNIDIDQFSSSHDTVHYSHKPGCESIQYSIDYLMLSTLGKNSRQHFKIFFLFFSENVFLNFK